MAFLGNGFWEPHTSSIDFCEPNYAVSNYIAEPHNTWSSLLIAAMGLIGVIYGNPGHDLAVTAMFGVLFVIGLGSAALHCTLHWLPQSSDEIPMLWQMLTFLHSVIVIFQQGKKENRRMIGLLFATLAIIQTYFYYQYQSIYIVFIISMIVYSILVVVSTCWLSFESKDRRSNEIRWWLWKWAFSSYALFGFILWVIDMNYCDALMPTYRNILGGMTLHILWHIFAGLGSYLISTQLCAIILQKSGKEIQLAWKCFLPICQFKEKR